ncbi:MAG: hypothetical protein IJ873_06710 [Lachnospiraceae bacterium]|nr:hypothetical protein [Lachnospiraceae bacterium]
MKKILKLLAVSALFTLIFAMPVMADDLDDTKAYLDAKLQGWVDRGKTYSPFMSDQLDKEKAYLDAKLQGYVDAAHAARQAQADLFCTQKVNSIVADAQNYALYLQKLTGNKAETTRIKKEIVDNYTYLSQFNPEYVAKMAEAEAVYQAALADQMAEQAHADAAKAAAYSAQMPAFALNYVDTYVDALGIAPIVEAAIAAGIQ